jgi:CheY-like chemotaxis protein
MEKRYDLFEFQPDAFPRWIGSASDLPEARKKVESLPPPAPGGEYLVREFSSGVVVAYTVPGQHGATIFPPAKDPRDPSDVLKSELSFLASGGYSGSDQTPHKPTRIFRDSPSCINFGDPDLTRPCEKCLLMEFVPPAARSRILPCHQIPLNAQEDTVQSLTAKGSHEGLEKAVQLWLRATIARIEEPRVQAAAAQRRVRVRPQAEREHRPRVLIIDDDEGVLTALERVLEEAGYDATTAWSGRDALGLLREGSFDLVLLDHDLPDVNSEEILRQLRGLPARTPVVVMQTSSLTDKDAVRLARLGACRFVSKQPLEDLVALVPSYLARATQCATCA